MRVWARSLFTSSASARSCWTSFCRRLRDSSSPSVRVALSARIFCKQSRRMVNDSLDSSPFSWNISLHKYHNCCYNVTAFKVFKNHFDYSLLMSITSHNKLTILLLLLLMLFIFNAIIPVLNTIHLLLSVHVIDHNHYWITKMWWFLFWFWSLLSLS